MIRGCVLLITRLRGVLLRAAVGGLGLLAIGCGESRSSTREVSRDLLAFVEAADTVIPTQRIDLGVDEPEDRPLLGFGWSYPERSDEGVSFTWGAAPYSQVRWFSLDGGGGTFVLRAFPLLADDGSPRVLTALLNGERWGELALTEGWREYRLEVPVGSLRRGFNTLTFIHGALTRVGDRHLASAFDELRFEPEVGVRPSAQRDREANELPPFHGLRYRLRLPRSAELEVLGDCSNEASARAEGRLEVWLGKGDSEPEVVDAWNPCGGSSRHLKLPGSGIRELFVVHAGPLGAPAVRLRRLRLEGLAEERTRLPPSLILVVLDALRADHLGSWGYDRPTSPNFDQLAARGVSFTHAFAQAPFTASSMPSIFTGLYPPAHGADTRHVLGEGPETLTERLAAAGYATVGFSANPFFGRRFGLDRGFDEFYELFSTGFHQRGLDYMVRGEAVLREVDRWLGRERGKPAFMVVHLMQPHAPYAPPASFRSLFGNVDSFDGSEETLSAALAAGAEAAERLRQPAIDLYDANIRYSDALLGQFLSRLELLGMLDTAVVAVTSDHGEEFLEHGHFNHLGYLFDESLHVPLVFALPGQEHAGRRIETLVETLDIGSTLLELTGLEPALGEGRSLLSLLREEEASRRPVYAFSRQPDHPVVSLREGIAALRTRHYKLICSWAGDVCELYDLRDDPGELKDLALERPDLVERMRGRLMRRLEVTSSQAPLARGEAQIDASTRRQLEALGYLR